MESCARCHGQGILFVRKEKDAPCNCVLRAVFRACYNRFRECVALEEQINPVTLLFSNGADGRRNYGRRREEFMADFDLVSRRALDEMEYKIFRIHFLLGADWHLCCARLNMSKGDFYHAVYSIMEKLGRIFAELRPYPLYPLDEYFWGMIPRKEPARELTYCEVSGDFGEEFAPLQCSA